LKKLERGWHKVGKGQMKIRTFCTTQKNRGGTIEKRKKATRFWE